MTFPLGAPNKHSLPYSVLFFKIILKTNLGDGKFKLPKSFTRKHADNLSKPVLLKPPDGTEWKIYWTNHDDKIWFQEGWNEFVTYYSLDHGHLLLFEYKGTSFFDVHIFDTSALEIDYPIHGTHDEKNGPEQISDDHVETLEHSSCQKTLAKSTVLSPQPCKKMKGGITTNFEGSSNGVNLLQHVHTRVTRLQAAKFIKQELKEDDDEGICTTKCSKVEQLTSTKISVALNKASTFRSKHPYFMLVMNPSFVNGQELTIPPQFAEKYLKETQAVFLLEVLDGRTWPVIYSAPRINVGWQKFASENNLNVGDVCVFELKQKMQGLSFKVSIFQEEPSGPMSQGGNASQMATRLRSHCLMTTGPLEEAEKFTSENPFFMVRVTKYYLTNRMRVPKRFVKQYFAPNEQNVRIRFGKKLWAARLVFDNASRTSGKFNAGWLLFARESKLQVGDVCIFELVNRKKVVLDVHIFRKLQLL